MTLQQAIVRDISTLDESELVQVAQYLSFLKFRERTRRQPTSEQPVWESLYQEAANEDRELAEAGMADYSASLASEDAR